MGWRLISGHIFHDGNKRTGIRVCLLTLYFNGFELHATDEELEYIALEIAQNHISQDEFILWVQQRTQKIKRKRRK
ncbi:MAG: type II toxin-antitoxin system death-on-curing family toxin [Herpetosiphon sp.]|nr:type II toxin-antitoxin system death-on-curing family toxin [Herpetosiphon sp.]